MHNTHGSEIFLAEEMKKFEKLNFLKKNSYLFMKRAGYEVFKFIKNNFKNKQSIIVLCGPGNNGGDGFIIGNYLYKKNYNVEVFCLQKIYNYKY